MDRVCHAASCRGSETEQSSEAASYEDVDDEEDEPQETGNVVRSLIDNVISMTNSIISENEAADDDADYEDELDTDPDDEEA